MTQVLGPKSIIQNSDIFGLLLQWSDIMMAPALLWRCTRSGKVLRDTIEHLWNGFDDSWRAAIHTRIDEDDFTFIFNSFWCSWAGKTKVSAWVNKLCAQVLLLITLASYWKKDTTILHHISQKNSLLFRYVISGVRSMCPSRHNSDDRE